MMLTLLTVLGIAGVLATMYVMIANTHAAEALAGETTLAGLADASAETLPAGHRVAHYSRTDWHLATVNELNEAEELLDVLENQGFVERELVVLGNSCFTIRWR